MDMKDAMALTFRLEDVFNEIGKPTAIMVHNDLNHPNVDDGQAYFVEVMPLNPDYEPIQIRTGETAEELLVTEGENGQSFMNVPEETEDFFNAVVEGAL